MGGLHIEMALLNVLGDWLEGSGWAAILASANRGELTPFRVVHTLQEPSGLIKYQQQLYSVYKAKHSPLPLCAMAFSIHVRDLMQLEDECPTVWNEFLKGHFVTQ